MNFSNEITEISFVRFLLPIWMSMKCPKEEVPKGEVLRKKPIVATKLLKFKGVRREKKKIMTTKLPKFKGGEKKKKKIVASRI